MDGSSANIIISDNFSTADYLERINCPLDVNPSAKYLKLLHSSHLLHVPFENLDNFIGRQVILDMGRVYKKIVVERRGGFCYELNGLFYCLLQALGFSVNFISVRVFRDAGLSPEFDHMALVAKFEHEQYLVDVGFGDAFIRPLRLQPGTVQMDRNVFYQIDKNIDGDLVMQSSRDSVVFRNEYQFSLKKRNLVEFIKMCEFHNTNKDSHLVKWKYVTQAQRNGRITLFTDELHILKNGKTEKIPVSNIDDFHSKLYQHFGVKLSPEV